MAKIEAKILYDIKRKDINNESHCMKIIDSFTFYNREKEYYTIVTEKLGYSLFDFIKMNEYHGYPISQVQRFSREILLGMNFMHKNGLIHSDLKPENILFSNKNYIHIKDTSKFPSNVIDKEKMFDLNIDNSNFNDKNQMSKSTSINSFSRSDYSMKRDEMISKYRIPSEDNNQLKIIDFGGALYSDKRTKDIINTRQYRAPEDLLGCLRWDERSDMWSIGCIIFELYTGEVLFPTHNDQEHLCLIEKAFGTFPKWMIEKSDKSLRNLFDCGDNRIDYDKLNHKYEVMKEVDKMKKIETVILKEHNIFKEFLIFLLQVDPNKRPTCEEALNHPFFSEIYNDNFSK